MLGSQHLSTSSFKEELAHFLGSSHGQYPCSLVVPDTNPPTNNDPADNPPHKDVFDAPAVPIPDTLPNNFDPAFLAKMNLYLLHLGLTLVSISATFPPEKASESLVSLLAADGASSSVGTAAVIETKMARTASKTNVLSAL